MKRYTREDVEALVYELLAVSILETLPEEKLDALDAALSGSDEAFDIFLHEQVPAIEGVLKDVCNALALPEGVC